MIKEDLLPLQELRPYTIAEADRQLVISMSRKFNSFEHANNWAKQIIQACQGPYSSIRIELTGIPMVNSTFIGGLLMIREAFEPTPIVLVSAADKIIRVLEIMHCADFFTYA